MQSRPASRVDETGVRTEARCSPAVLRVEPAVCWEGAGLDPGDKRLHEGGKRGGDREPARLVRHADLEGAEARMGTDVPPEPHEVVGKAQLDQ